MNWQIPPMPPSTKLVGGMAIFGVVGAMWSRIKATLFKFYSVFVVTIECKDQRILKALSMLFWEEFQPVGFRTRKYDCSFYFRPSIRKRELVLYEDMISTSMIFRQGYRFLSFGGGGGDKGGSNLSFLRGTFDADELVHRAMERFKDKLDNKESGRFYVTRRSGHRNEVYSNSGHGNHSKSSETVEEAVVSDSDEGSDRLLGQRPVGCDPDDIGYRRRKENGDVYILSDDLTESIEEARFWLESKDWFLSRGIPWKRGWNLYGAPGTGKTAFVRYLAKYLDLPIIIFDLSTFTNEGFVSKWNGLSSYSPCIVLFEDIDAVFHGRENITDTELSKGVTFNCLLNCIDGIEETNGLFLIITTNDISKIDSALGVPTQDGQMSSRPGRIDKVIHFPPLNEKRQRELAAIILSDFPDVVDSVIAKAEGDTGAQFVNRCCKIAEKLYWERKFKAS